MSKLLASLGNLSVLDTPKSLTYPMPVHFESANESRIRHLVGGLSSRFHMAPEEARRSQFEIEQESKGLECYWVQYCGRVGLS